MKLTIITMALTLSLTSVASHASGSSEHSHQASKHSGQAIKHTVYAAGTGTVSVAKAASTAVAVPLLVVGGTLAYSGGASTQKGSFDLNTKNSASNSNGELPITDTTVIADPAPNKALN